MHVFRREDLSRVAVLAESEANRILDGHVRTGARRSFDAISDLITRVPLRICRDYYGIPIAPDEEDAVIEWSLGMSAYMFGDPNDDPKYAAVGLAAGDAMRPVLDNAVTIARARKAGDTIIDRFVAMQSADPSITDDVIRANLLGMVTGFVPTNTMASGHMLDSVVGGGWFLSWRRRMFMGPVKKALAARDDERFFRCLLETLRFRPINPGPFRVCIEDYTIDGAGFLGRGPKTIRKGAKVLASTQSAMFDGRRMKNGRKFDPDRASSEYMHFGSGLHICVGAFLAEAQITPTLRALLTRKGLCRARGGAGKLKRAGPFPAHLKVQFAAESVGPISRGSD
jgi:cytochrome P450